MSFRSHLGRNRRGQRHEVDRRTTYSGPTDDQDAQVSKLPPALIGLIRRHQLACQYVGQHCNHKRDSQECLLHLLHKHIDTVSPALVEIGRNMSKYDATEDCKANGYRSVIEAYDRSFGEFFKCLKNSKWTMHFRLTSAKRRCHLPLNAECLNWMEHLIEFERIILLSEELQKSSDELVVPSEKLTSNFLMGVANSLFHVKSFLGRPVGFQYVEELKWAMTLISSAMGVFHDCPRSSSGEVHPSNLVAKSMKYWYAPEDRIKKAHKSYQSADVGFCRTLLNLGSFKVMKYISKLQDGLLAVNIAYKLPRVPIHLLPPVCTASCKMGSVELPECEDPLKVFLLAKDLTKGALEPLKLSYKFLESEKYAAIKPPDILMFYIHGGGFVVKASTVHEVHLRAWIKDLNLPVVSIDYEVAPTRLFPFALDQCFYAYIWTLTTKPLGWTGKYIILAGDSSGGNLAAAVCVKALTEGIRKPDQLYLFYPALQLTGDLSPSRVFSIFDPILNMSVNRVCVEAYFGLCSDSESKQRDQSDIDVRSAEKLLSTMKVLASRPKDPYASPLFASDEVLAAFPETFIFASSADPLLDDSVAMARKLTAVKTENHLEVFHNLPHGFLALSSSSRACNSACMASLDIMRRAIGKLRARRESTAEF